MTLRNTLFLGALSTAWGAAVSGAEDDFISPLIGFMDAGVLCGQDGGVQRDAPDTIAGTTHVIEDAPPFVSKGRVVPAALGIGFGVRAALASDTGQTDILMSVTHPPLADSGITQQSFTTYIGPKNLPGITLYQFDYPYELALGDWTMTASYGGVTLYEITFTVVPPAALPELAGVCGYQDLLS